MIRGASVMIALIIGAGIFGVPYVFVQGGLAGTLFLAAAVGGILLLFHLLFAEVFLRTRERHRLPGLVRLYLGKRWVPIAYASDLLGSWGVLFAYVLVGGSFLKALLRGVWTADIWWYQLAIFAIGAAGVYLSLRSLANLEIPLAIFMFAAILLIVAESWFAVTGASLRSFQAWGHDPLAAYGVLMFALSGAGAIPQVRDLLRGRERALASTICIGTLASLAMVVLFGIGVASVTGLETTEDAFTGFVKATGNGVAILGALFGLVAVLTSFFSVGEYVQGIFEYDLRYSSTSAWALAMSPPLALFLLGAQSFIGVLSITGAVFIGAAAVLIGLIAIRARRHGNRKPEFVVPLSTGAILALIALLAAGALIEIARHAIG